VDNIIASRVVVVRLLDVCADYIKGLALSLAVNETSEMLNAKIRRASTCKNEFIHDNESTAIVELVDFFDGTSSPSRASVSETRVLASRLRGG
jgi:hypothetical protein